MDRILHQDDSGMQSIAWASLRNGEQCSALVVDLDLLHFRRFDTDETGRKWRGFDMSMRYYVPVQDAF